MFLSCLGFKQSDFAITAILSDFHRKYIHRYESCQVPNEDGNERRWIGRIVGRRVSFRTGTEYVCIK